MRTWLGAALLPRRSGAVRIAAACTALAAMLLGACTYGPAEDYLRVQNVALNAEATRLAVLVRYQRYQRATGLAAFPDGGVPRMLIQRADVYVVDLPARTVQQRVTLAAPSAHQVSFNPWLIGWRDAAVYLRVSGCAGSQGDECWGPLVTHTSYRLEPSGLVQVDSVPRLRLVSAVDSPSGYLAASSDRNGISLIHGRGGPRIPLLRFDGLELVPVPP